MNREFLAIQVLNVAIIWGIYNDAKAPMTIKQGASNILETVRLMTKGIDVRIEPTNIGASNIGATMQAAYYVQSLLIRGTDEELIEAIKTLYFVALARVRRVYVNCEEA